MTRKIKFRVYLPNEGYIKDDNVIFLRRVLWLHKEKITPEGAIHHYQWNINKLLNDLSDGQILEQFTGLTDWNGKDVYEGDVLRDRLVDIVVSWDEERAGWYPFCRYDELKAWHPEEKRFEVVGNIHENPELLEERDDAENNQI